MKMPEAEGGAATEHEERNMNESRLRAIGAAEPGSIQCSFCGKGQREVGTIVTGKTVFICDECIGLCVDILAEEDGQPIPERERPKDAAARRRELGELARRLAEGCWGEHGLPKVMGHLAMALASELDPERQPDVP